MRPQSSLAEKKGLRLDDEVRFIRSWLEKPLAIGAVCIITSIAFTQSSTRHGGMRRVARTWCL